MSVFASRFDPELDAGTLSDYLKEKLRRDVNCQKIGSENRRFSSFKVSAECKEVNEMYNPDLWPDGALVQRYYEPRKAVIFGQNLHGITEGLSQPTVPIGSH